MSVPEVMTKAEYAQYRGFTPPRLTALLKEGRIRGDALQGQGRRARIVVAIAEDAIGR